MSSNTNFSSLDVPVRPRHDHEVRSAERRAPRRKPLVFLAEDDLDLRRVLCESLRESGFDVVTAATGHEMLKLLSAASRHEVRVPDAFVMDIRMPKCSGIDILSALRLADWQQPVVMITGFGDPELHEQAAAYGASVVLDKPVDTSDLVDMLDVLLRFAHAEVMRPAMYTLDEEEDDAPQTARCPVHDALVVAKPIKVRFNLGAK